MKDEEVAVRAMQAGDVEAILKIVREILGEYGFAPDMGGVRADLAGAAERYAAPRGGIWVATAAGVVVGSVGIRPKEGRTAELKRLYLSPTLRGKGLGQRLYAHAETFARGAGYERVWLDSSRRFTAARRLYERNGFVRTASLDNDWEDDVWEKSLLRPD